MAVVEYTNLCGTDFDDFTRVVDTKFAHGVVDENRRWPAFVELLPAAIVVHCRSQSANSTLDTLAD